MSAVCILPLQDGVPRQAQIPQVRESVQGVYACPVADLVIPQQQGLQPSKSPCRCETPS